MGKQNVIVLGAGASAPEGAPLQSELFREYFKYQREHPLESRRAMDARLADFFMTFFGIDTLNGDLDSIEFPTFEEALGMIDLAVNRLESFRHYGLDPVVSIFQVNVDLVMLIAIILDHKVGGECVFHGELMGNLERQGRLDETCFVDFNYDILMDNALMALGPETGVDYGIRFVNDPETTTRPRLVPLYKMHGSLNWLFCPTCVALSLTPGTGSASSLVFEPEGCPTCGTVIFPIIVPPSFIKGMTDLNLQTIWRCTERSLMQAERIFFCGYSFPDADIHIKYILKRAEVNGISTPEIVVINDYPGKPVEQTEVERSRYSRFLKDSGRLDFREQSFEQFCAEGIPD